MVNVNRNPGTEQRYSVGWDPYEVWAIRIRRAALQLAPPRDTNAQPDASPQGGSAEKQAWARALIRRSLQVIRLISL
jgi:hypothetical protein